MRPRPRLPLWCFAAACFCVAGAYAQDYTQGGIKVANPWTRSTPAGGKNAAVFLEITGTGNQADRLVAARSPAASRAELHTHTMENGIAKMHKVDGIVIPAGKSVMLAPDGFHIMLFDLKEPLKQGGTAPLTLVFEKAGTIPIEASVEPLSARGPAASMHHGAHAHDQ